tara:strand:- start:2907 stop:3743 length:837 start_codon:yes stop_codon:yes gene_type:complete
LKEILYYSIIEIGSYNLTIHKLILLLLIFLAVKILLWVIKKAMKRQWRFKNLDKGSEHALFQIIKYILWIIAIAMILETLGVKVTLLIAGSAALLVGVGLGLQQTFNDIISGVILLLEGSTKIGDVLEIDGDVVKVRNIGLRASKVINRDDIMIFIPNSLLVTNKVINWSHQIQETRYHINVGVAYGSDVDLVIKLIEESAIEHTDCSKKKEPEGRFLDFGESSLNFEVLFWSKELFRIDRAKSDIRRNIDQKFRDNGITIPFPQRDLHIKSNNINFK